VEYAHCFHLSKLQVFLLFEKAIRESRYISMLRKERSKAKFWVGADVQLADSRGFSANELNIIWKIINNRKSEIEAAWNEHFNS